MKEYEFTGPSDYAAYVNAMEMVETDEDIDFMIAWREKLGLDNEEDE